MLSRRDVARYRMSLSAWALALAFLATWASPARAELADDAARVARFWELDGAKVERLAPIFVEHGAGPVVPIAAGDPLSSGCVVVAFIASRAVDFTVTPGDAAPSDNGALAGLLGLAPAAEDGDVATSIAGALSLQRCGADRAELAHLTLQMRSPRGAIEVVVARSEAPLDPYQSALPERARGPLAPRGDPGLLAEPGPVGGRLVQLDAATREDGAAHFITVTMRSSMLGTGEFVLRMSEGCHRVSVLAEIPKTLPRRVTDVDAEAREEEGGRVLARDRGEAAGARLDFCLGASSSVVIGFVGASGATDVTVADAVWLLPKTLPTTWGGRARGGFASALWRRRVMAPETEPVFETLGVQGSTPAVIAIEPGACYLAAVATIRGDASVMRLSATVGDSVASEQVGEDLDGAALSFCSEVDRLATLRVDARGGSSWWALSLWRVGAPP